MDPGAHQFPAMLVDTPALPPALIALHLPVVAVLIATGNVHPCKHAQKASCNIFQTSWAAADCRDECGVNRPVHTLYWTWDMTFSPRRGRFLAGEEASLFALQEVCICHSWQPQRQCSAAPASLRNALSNPLLSFVTSSRKAEGTQTIKQAGGKSSCTAYWASWIDTVAWAFCESQTGALALFFSKPVLPPNPAPQPD